MRPSVATTRFVIAIAGIVGPRLPERSGGGGRTPGGPAPGRAPSRLRVQAIDVRLAAGVALLGRVLTIRSHEQRLLPHRHAGAEVAPGDAVARRELRDRLPSAVLRPEDV